MEKQKCEHKIWGKWGSPYQCRKNAVVQRDGKWHCKIHDPEYIRAKQEERQVNFDKERAESMARGDLDQARKDATKGLTLEVIKTSYSRANQAISNPQIIIKSEN
ncbi:MAG: hypothetical protein Q8O55_04035 [Dehalococcoidales bacterium]|nr:hypothetical protein [Dehalococcoidales bacterium]